MENSIRLASRLSYELYRVNIIKLKFSSIESSSKFDNYQIEFECFSNE